MNVSAKSAVTLVGVSLVSAVPLLAAGAGVVSASPVALAGKTSGTFTGKTSHANKYGPVKVSIVVSKGRIVKVNVPVYPKHSASGPINKSAIPQLRREVLASQSASVSQISGASLTVKAFKKSLQSAMVKAGL